MALRETLAHIPLDSTQMDAMKERDRLEEAVKTQGNAAKKTAQRELEKWKMTHIGPKWANAETLWKQ